MQNCIRFRSLAQGAGQGDRADELSQCGPRCSLRLTDTKSVQRRFNPPGGARQAAFELAARRNIAARHIAG